MFDLWIISTLFIFGLCVGSFLNVLALRHHSGRRLTGRSRCSSCNHELGWPDLVPVFSFIFLGGRCRFCRSRIASLYPLGELSTGIVFLLVGWRLGITFQTFFYLAIFALLVAITIYDFHHQIIPDRFVYPLIGISVAAAAFDSLFFGYTQIDFWFRVISGLVAFLFFFLFWFSSRGRWMGLGDAKLALAIGILLGPVASASAFSFSFLLGALLGVILIGWSMLVHYQWRRRMLRRAGRSGYRRLSPLTRAFTMKSEMPFAPFMVVGAIVAFLFPNALFSALFLLAAK